MTYFGLYLKVLHEVDHRHIDRALQQHRGVLHLQQDVRKMTNTTVKSFKPWTPKKTILLVILTITNHANTNQNIKCDSWCLCEDDQLACASDKLVEETKHKISYFFYILQYDTCSCFPFRTKVSIKYRGLRDNTIQIV